MVTSYDRNLRVFDKWLKLTKIIEFGNILQKIENLHHEETYAVAVSKELHIIKLEKDKNY